MSNLARSLERMQVAVRSSEQTQALLRSAERMQAAVRSSERMQALGRSAERMQAAVRSSERMQALGRSAERMQAAVRSSERMQALGRSAERMQAAVRSSERMQALGRVVAPTGEGIVSMDQLSYYESKLAYETDSADLYESIENGEPVVVVDGRAAGAYAHEHIPDAISLPQQEISADTTASWDRSKLYVCYCDGIGCNASTKTAMKLLTLGFQVRELIGGLDWWKRDGYPTHLSEAGVRLDIKCGCN